MTDRGIAHEADPPWAVDDPDSLRDDADDFEDELLIEWQSRLRPLP
jgi:hypothetical protein